MGDRQAVSRLFSQFSQKEIKQTLPYLKLTPKSKNFWNLYLN